MFELMIQLSRLALPVFVFLTMANVGMTQNLRDIVRYWSDWPFYLKMVAVNFVASPALMWVLLQPWSLPGDMATGLVVFSLCAGAPFLIKLTAASEHDLALGAATMMLLVLATIVLVPLLLPLLLPSLTIDAGGMAWTLVRQLLIPMVLGALLAFFAPDLNERLQPWVAKIGTLALWVVLVATILGYLPEMPGIIRSGALLVGLAYVIGAFGLGYVAGKGADHLEDVGGLATAQRNTAAALLIAASSFEDPTVFVLIALVNTIGIVLLLGLAKFLKRDNETA